MTSVCRKSAPTCLLEEKLARIDATHRRAGAQARRDHAEVGAAGLGGERAGVRSASALEHKQAFDAYVRPGESAGLRALEQKALVGRLQSGRRLSGAAGSRNADRRAADGDLADPLDCRPAHHQRQCLQEAVHDGRPRGRLGRRDRRAHADGVADARRAVVPGDGALRHAGGDLDAAGGLGGQHRRMARPGSRAGVRGAGRHGVCDRRRQQQAEGLPRLHHGGECVVELGQYRLYRLRRRPARFRRAIRPTCWSI